MSPPVAELRGDGGRLVFDVTAPETCRWNAVTPGPWIVIEGAGTGTGSGRFVALVAATPLAERNGWIVLGGSLGHSVTIIQRTPTPPPCRFFAVPTTTSVVDAGAQVAVQVSATDGCAWTATSDVPWITITEGWAGAGSGRVTATVAPNPGRARTGMLIVAGIPVPLLQPGGCTYSITPSTLSATRDSASATVTVTTAAGCAWTAVSPVEWTTLTGATSGNGPGTLRVVIAAAPACRMARSASLTIAGESFWVDQFVGTCLSSVNGSPSGGFTP